MVMQYNKRDLKDKGIPLMPAEMMEKELNRQLKAPSFSASAFTGENIVPTLKKIVSVTLASLQDSLT
jgi:hypothetical protein